MQSEVAAEPAFASVENRTVQPCSRGLAEANRDESLSRARSARMKLLALAACAAPRVATPVVVANSDDPAVVVPIGPFPSLDAYCVSAHDCSPVDLHGARGRTGPFDAVVPMQLSDPMDSRCVVALERDGGWFVAPPDGRICAEEERSRTRRARVVALDAEMVEIDFDVADPSWYQLSMVCAARADAVRCTPLFESRSHGHRSSVTVRDGVVTVTSRGEPSDGDGVYRLLQTPNPMPTSTDGDRGASTSTP